MMIYNTMTGNKEAFEPIHRNRVNMFVCGPTVYDEAHIGHARTYIAFDVVARYLAYRGFGVFYLQNVTDVDDKIIKRGAELGITTAELARRFEGRYLEDMYTLGVKSVNLYARATDHIPEIIDQIKRLIEKGYAYETETGVYFDVSKFPEFGELSHQTPDSLTKHRIEPDPTKRNPADFSLWKKREEGLAWDSPWGRGRPGWHIEDTAITETYFGPRYDIHGGARDLIFPHHEAEIAQAEASSGKKPMVKYWMHTGFLNINGEKMSKSLGNFTTIRDLRTRFSPKAFRLFVLSTHYRSPIDFTEGSLDQSARSLERISNLVQSISDRMKNAVLESAEVDEEMVRALETARGKFLEAMDDDFNTPLAFSVLFDLVRDLNRYIGDEKTSKNVLSQALNLFAELGGILGLEFKAQASGKVGLTDDLVELIMEIRQKLRERKDWTLSDEIRDRLRDLKLIVEDKKVN
jgi:cysteinyl-tRNA synthetase